MKPNSATLGALLLACAATSFACGPEGDDDDDQTQAQQTPDGHTAPPATPTAPGATPTAPGATPTATPRTPTPPPPTAVPGSPIEMSPARVDFDELLVGCSTRVVVGIENTSEGTVELLGALASGAGVVSVDTTLSTQLLNPGQLGTLTLDIDALTPGRAAVTIQLISATAPSVAAELSLVGDVVTPSHNQDSFVQASADKVDVLLVIDDSGSMADKQGALADSIEQLGDTLLAAELSYHVGFVTMETLGAEAGVLVGDYLGNNFIDNSFGINGFVLMMDAINALRQDQRSQEMGLEAMHLALSEPRLSEQNLGFYRPDAYLSVIFFTDEADFSPGYNAPQVSGYPDLYLSFMADLIAQDGPAIAHGGLNLAEPYGYDALIESTGGLMYPSQDVNWADSMAALSLASLGYQTVFALSFVPAGAQELEVFVNGDQVPQGFATWRYDATHNAVVFNPSAPPTQGDSIVVRGQGSQSCGG